MARAEANPPHANDYPTLDRMARIGIVPGESFSLDSAPGHVRRALEVAPGQALRRIKAAWTNAGVAANGWRTNLTAIGTYGIDYLHRAGVAYGGLGANAPDDAVYPTAFADADGQPFSSGSRYIMRFEPGRTPPARAFWSLTIWILGTAAGPPDQLIPGGQLGSAAGSSSVYGTYPGELAEASHGVTAQDRSAGLSRVGGDDQVVCAARGTGSADMGEQASMVSRGPLRVVKDIDGRCYRRECPGAFGCSVGHIGHLNADAVLGDRYRGDGKFILIQ